MVKLTKFNCAILFMMILQGCEKSSVAPPVQQQVPSPQENTAQSKSNSKEDIEDSSSANTKLVFKTIEWPELMPKDDLEALLNPPAYIDELEDGSIEDQITSQVQNSLLAASDDRYQQALSSTRIMPEMNGQAIRIPGFIVPVLFDDEQAITQFFIVPFFGACLHLPPPPPNQIIFIEYDKGLNVDAFQEPYWFSGVLKTALIDNETATSAYSMQLHKFEVFTEWGLD